MCIFYLSNSHCIASFFKVCFILFLIVFILKDPATVFSQVLYEQ